MLKSGNIGYSMRSRLGVWSQNPVILLCLVAALSAFVIQSGELGTSDTAHRLQTTHSFWTSEPEVFPYEYPEFGLHGRGGKLHSWYGMGQSLLMLPADVVGTYIARLPIFDEYDDTDPTVRSIFVSYTTNILISVLTVLICLRLLRQFGFTIREAVLGVLALLFCTTHLHYTQNMMENNYIMLLTLTGFSYQYEWLGSGKGRALFWGSAALGLNLLTRLTTALDIAAVGIFLLLVLWFQGELHRWRTLLWSYLKIAMPVIGFFFLIDRIYQYVRFGSFFNTYVTVFGQEFRQRDPSLPANFPWNNPLHTGLLSPFFMPEKSILLFDPLIALTILVMVFGWRRFGPDVRAYLLSAFLLILGDVAFYARYFAWAGDMAWGDRYVSTAVELVAFISVPLMFRYRAELGKFVRMTGLGLVGVSLVIQLASLAFWLPLEIYQMETFGHPTFVVLLRLKNVVAFALGKMDAWGLNTPTLTQDPWDYVHITTWNFLPFLLRRVGEAPAWVVRVIFAVWGTALAALALTLLRLRAVMKAL
jgi:small-conductance mechanosensitive channel